MRNNKKKLSFSNEIVSMDKVLKAVEKRLPDEILDLCYVGFRNSYPYGYVISFTCRSDEIIMKKVEVSFRVSNYDAWVMFEEITCFLKEDFKQMKESYNEDIQVPEKKYKPSEKNIWEKRKKYVHNKTVIYIVDNITKYFGTNAEKFIINIK